MKNIKIDDVQSFVAAVRHQSISRAAMALGLTQPAVTRRIQSLEESLGADLLDRNTKPPRPNAVGLRVLDQCEKVLREVEALQALLAAGERPQGRLRLGVTQSVAESGISRLLDEYSADYPELEVHLQTRWSGELLRGVENGELDAAGVAFPAGKVFPAAVAAQPLGRVEMGVVVARQAWPERPQPYRLSDLRQCRWIVNPDGCGFRARLQHALTELGLPFRLAMDAFGTALQLEMVAGGLGLGLASRAQLERSEHRAGLRLLALEDFDPSMEMWLVQRPHPGAFTAPLGRFSRAVADSLAAG